MPEDIFKSETPEERLEKDKIYGIMLLQSARRKLALAAKKLESSPLPQSGHILLDQIIKRVAELRQI